MMFLPYYMFLEATGLMPLYQFNMQMLSGMTRMFQPVVPVGF